MIRDADLQSIRDRFEFAFHNANSVDALATAVGDIPALIEEVIRIQTLARWLDNHVPPGALDDDANDHLEAMLSESP